MRDIMEREDLILAAHQPVRVEAKPTPNTDLNAGGSFWSKPITEYIQILSSSKTKRNNNAIYLSNLEIIANHFETLNNFWNYEGLHMEDGFDALKGVYESRHRTRLVMEKYGLKFNYTEHSCWWSCKDPWNKLLHECPTATRPKYLWHDKEEATPSKPRTANSKQHLKN